MFSFFVNKEFYFRISFDLNNIVYTSTRERFLITKAKNIIDIIKNILEFIRRNAKLARKKITTQIDKYRKSIIYNIDDIIFLNRRYIKIARSFDKLDNKKLNLFKIIVKRKIFYELELLSIIKIHSIFYI